MLDDLGQGAMAAVAERSHVEILSENISPTRTVTSVLALPRKRLAHTCKRNIQMTPLCNIEVTPPRVVGSGGCTVVVLSMSKQELNRHRHGNRVGRSAARDAVSDIPASAAAKTQRVHCLSVARLRHGDAR